MDFNFKNYLKESDTQGRIKMLIYGQNFIFFFIYKDNVYGGSEDARLTYAAMKSNEEGAEDMTFGATNLSSSVKGKPTDEYFVLKDVDWINIIQNKDAEQMLLKHTTKNKNNNTSHNLQNRNSEKNGQFGLHKISMDVE